MALVQYFVFKQGADIHVFWPHYFAAFVALGMGALTESMIGLGGLVRRLVARRHPSRAARPLDVAVAMGMLLLPLGFILRDGAPALAYARATGGRFNEKGLYIDTDGAKTAMLRWVAPQLAPRAVVGLHEGMKATWAQVWSLGGRIVKAPHGLPRAASGIDEYFADTRLMPDVQRAELVASRHVRAIGPFWWVTTRAPAAPIDAFAFVEREPGPVEWYLLSGSEPIRTIEPDAFATWELRTHFDQPVEPPTVEPQGLEQQRIAHNVALATGDVSRAEALRGSLERAFAGPAVPLGGGHVLVGRRFERGVEPALTLLMRAAGPVAGELDLRVRSRVVRAPLLSTTMADPTEREVAPPLALSPRRWRSGFLYSHRVVIRKRPGTEHFELRVRLRGSGGETPAIADAGPIELLRLD
jgi:hypothetical protein